MPKIQNRTSSAIAIQIRFTMAPAAWNRNHKTSKIAAMTRRVWIKSSLLLWPPQGAALFSYYPVNDPAAGFT